MNFLQFLHLSAVLLLTSAGLFASAGNFFQDTQPSYGGDERVKILESGRLLNLTLDHSSGSGFQSKNEFLFGRFDVRLKLVPGNSAGTVTTFYLYSEGDAHDEVDFEFLGNSSGQPYTIHTNVYSHGKGEKEQRFQPWFDPTAAYHNYSIVWNPQRIIFMIDSIPIRVFSNNEAIGVPFPKNKPMKIIATLWNADDWATQGGRVKTDWSNAPFTASYRDFNANACVWSAQTSSSSCNDLTQSTTSGGSGQDWQTQDLDAKARNRLRWVQQKFMIYNYCSDMVRFPQGLPPECKRQSF